MRRMISVVLAIALAMIPSAVMARGESEDSTVNINLAHVGAPTSPQHTIASMFAEKVALKTGGTVEITIHDSGTLGREKELQEGVRSGTVDMAIAGTFSHLVPWAGILETPMLYRDLEHFVAAFQGPVGEELVRTFENDVNVRPLFIVPHGGFRYITTANTPVREPSDMAGLKLRNPNVPSFNIMAEAVGAVPIPLDFSELYIALDRGTVDGQHNPTGHIVGQKFYEVQDYVSMVPWGISPHVVCISFNAWEKLNDAQKDQVMAAASETAREYPTVAKQEEDEQIVFLQDKMTVIEPSEIDMEAFQSVLRDRGVPRLSEEYGEEGVKWVRAIQQVQ